MPIVIASSNNADDTTDNNNTTSNNNDDNNSVAIDELHLGDNTGDNTNNAAAGDEYVTIDSLFASDDESTEVSVAQSHRANATVAVQIVCLVFVCLFALTKATRTHQKRPNNKVRRTQFEIDLSVLFCFIYFATFAL
jgi:hypothetical protein